MAVVHGGKPYPKHTKLGRVMAAKGLKVMDLIRFAGVHPRSATEYLAGRQRPSAKKTADICAFLQVSPELILEDSYPYTADMAAEREAQRMAGSERTNA